MKKIFFQILLAISFQQLALVAALSQSPSDPVGNSETDEVFTTVFTTFEYGGDKKRVWASVRNNPETNIEKWQFRYDPLMAFAYTSDGTPSFKVGKIGSFFSLEFQLILDDPIAESRALEQVKKNMAADADEVQQGNITAKAVSALSLFLSDDVMKIAPSASLANSVREFPTPKSSLPVRIDFTSEDDLENFKTALSGDVSLQLLTYEFSTIGSTTKVNGVKIVASHFLNSSLKAALDGLGTTEKYVHRSDARNLLRSSALNIAKTSYIESPDDFTDDFSDTILDRLFKQVTIDFKDLNDEVLSSTFNGKDLSPDVITKELNSSFTKDESKDSWSASGAMSSTIPIKNVAASSAKSLSGAQLKNRLREEGLHTEIEGELIKPKAITLHQLNAGSFSADLVIAEIKTIVQPPMNFQSLTGELRIERTGEPAFTDIKDRLTTLEQIFQKPIRTVVSESISVAAIKEPITVGNSVHIVYPKLNYKLIQLGSYGSATSALGGGSFATTDGVEGKLAAISEQGGIIIEVINGPGGGFAAIVGFPK